MTNSGTETVQQVILAQKPKIYANPQRSTTHASNTCGPWTPIVAVSSMSAVRLGPVTKTAYGSAWIAEDRRQIRGEVRGRTSADAHVAVANPAT